MVRLCLQPVRSTNTRTFHYTLYSMIPYVTNNKKLVVIIFPQNYQEGLRYIGRLPFEQAESNMKRYGKTLMHHVPEGTTLLLKGLCTNYQPSGDAAEKDSLDRSVVNKVSEQYCYSPR